MCARFHPCTANPCTACLVPMHAWYHACLVLPMHCRHHGFYKQSSAVFDEISDYANTLFTVVKEADDAATAVMDEQRSRRALAVSELQKTFSVDMKVLHTGFFLTWA